MGSAFCPRRILVAAIEVFVLVAKIVVFEIFPLKLNVQVVVIARIEPLHIRGRNRLNIGPKP